LGATFANTSFPLPWFLTTWLPGLSQMQATSRLLGGFSVALLLVAAQHSARWTKIFIPLIIIEGLLVSPSHWPIPAKAPLPASNIVDIENPVAFWPAAPVIASHKVTMTALMLEQPLSLFADTELKMPNANGRVQYGQNRKNKNGQNITEWKDSICSAQVRTLIQFRDIVGDNGQPFFTGVQTLNKHCQSSFCRWQLCENLERP